MLNNINKQIYIKIDLCKNTLFFIAFFHLNNIIQLHYAIIIQYIYRDVKKYAQLNRLNFIDFPYVIFIRHKVLIRGVVFEYLRYL